MTDRQMALKPRVAWHIAQLLRQFGIAQPRTSTTYSNRPYLQSKMQLCRAPMAARVPCSRVSRHHAGMIAPLRTLVIRRFKEGQDANVSTETAMDTQRQRLEEGLKDSNDAIKSNLEQFVDLPEMDSRVKINPATPAFTRRREVFTGRIAMLGFLAGCIGEGLNPAHPNILQQVSGLVGFYIPPELVLTLVCGIVLYNAGGAALPWGATASKANQQDVDKRRKGPSSRKITWGFTKANEVFNGRLAMLGIAGAMMNQMRIGGINGPGPLAQLALILGIPADGDFYGSLVPLFWYFCIFAYGASLLLGKTGNAKAEPDIY